MGCPSVGSSSSEITLPLSRTLRETRSGRNPRHAGGGPDAAVSPAFPVGRAALCSPG